MDKTQAVSFDSSPRFVRFESLSGDTQYMTGEGKVVGDLGTLLDLTGLKVPGVIPTFTGPTLNDLTGGTGNTIDFHLEGNPIVDGMTAGFVGFSFHYEGVPTSNPYISSLTAGSFHVTISCIDSTLLIFDLAYSDIVSLAAAQGQSVNVGIIDISSIGDLSSLVGKTISLVHIASWSNWTSSSPMNNPASQVNFAIQTSSAPYTAVALCNTDLEDSGDFTNIPSVPTVLAGWKININFDLVGEPSDSVWGPYEVAFDDFITYADGTGQGTQIGVIMPSTGPGAGTGRMPWDLTPLVGKTITAVNINISNAFAGAMADMNASSMTIQLNDGSLAPLAFFGALDEASSVTLPITPNQVIQAAGVGSLINIGIVLVGETEIVNVPISAADILAYNDAQTATFGVPNQRPNQDGPILVLPSVLFPDHAGWMVKKETNSTVTTAYGPGTLVGPSSIFISFLPQGEGRTGIGTITNLLTPTYDNSDNPSDIGTIGDDENSFIELEFHFFPKSTLPIIKNATITEAIELKNRNLPAFVFKFQKSSPPGEGDGEKTINLYAFVSQGDTNQQHEPKTPKNRQWSMIPIEYIEGLTKSSVATVSPFSLFLNSTIEGLPENFGRPVVTIAKEYIGPWDYVRFLLLPTLDEGLNPLDYTDWTLQIVANAREL